jgi:hypothetical protein
MHFFINACLSAVLLSLRGAALGSDGAVVEFGYCSCGVVLAGRRAGVCGVCCATATVAPVSAIKAIAVDTRLTVMLLSTATAERSR